MSNFFISIYNYFEKKRLLMAVIFGGSFLIWVFLALRLHFEEDISKILPHDRKVEKLNEVFQQSKFADKLVVTVSLHDTAASMPDSLVAYADELTSLLNTKLSKYINRIDYRVNDSVALAVYQSIPQHLPIFLTAQDYKSIDSLLEPEQVKKTLAWDIQTISSPEGLALKPIIQADPAGISFIALKKIRQLQYDENFILYDNVVMSRDQKQLLLFISPSFPPNNTGQNTIFLKGIDAIIDSLSATHYRYAHATYFGAAAVASGNANQLRRDTLFTQGATVLFLIIFLAVFFRRKSAPLIILLPVVYGAAFSLAMVWLVKGSISVIALGTGSVILGIAVNYSLHVFNHYRHTGNIRTVIADLSFPLTIGSLTTIGGFFGLEFVQSEMLKDLGLFAAFGLIGSSLCSLIFLPHIVVRQRVRSRPDSVIDTIAGLRPEYNRLLVAVIFIVTIFLFSPATRVGFENDMMHMNYMSPSLKKNEEKLNELNAYSLKSVYMLVDGKTLDDALNKNEKVQRLVDSLKRIGIIKKSSGISSLLISRATQQERIARWQQYWTVARKDSLIKLLQQSGAPIGFSAHAFDGFRNLLNTDFSNNNPAGEMAAVKTLLDDYIMKANGHVSIITLLKTTANNKAAIYKTFDHVAHVTVVDRQYLTDRLVEIMNSDFTRIALITSILVFIVLLLTYGRIELTLVSFLPMFIAWIWILGIMSLAGIQFNIVNIIVSALIFGLGDDYSLFIMDGLLQEYKTGKKNLSSFKSSIILSAITTVTGLGVLIFAKHPALRSIALISIIGILCVVIIAQILIPFLFSLLITNRVRKNLFPWTLSAFLKSVFAFTYFAIGSILLTIFGLVLVRLNFIDKEKGKLAYHRILSSFTKSLMYVMVNVKKKVINPWHENFEKPAVVICNHQSSLDILVATMLHPKLLLLTNMRVWKSPVFGFAIRMADYYPVAQGIENSVSLLEERVKKGYSIVVFPEGTRTQGDVLRRFHKGAFYLAEKLALDMVPVMIHGTSYTMSKGDFLLKDGCITVEFGQRIPHNSPDYGENYVERSKKIGSLFRASYSEMRERIEQPKYFAEKLRYNYLYKGPILEWYLRIKLHLENYYKPFHALLPKSGHILDIGCGYGFMAYLLNFSSPHRHITAIDYDEDKIAVASNCFSRPDNVNFHFADALDFYFEKYNAIILADVLHYLPPKLQIKLIEKCVDALLPGGMILIREGDRELKSKHRFTKLTEFFSTKLIRFNKTRPEGLSFLSSSAIRALANERNMECKEINDSTITSNRIFILTKKDE